MEEKHFGWKQYFGLTSLYFLILAIPKSKQKKPKNFCFYAWIPSIFTSGNFPPCGQTIANVFSDNSFKRALLYRRNLKNATCLFCGLPWPSADAKNKLMIQKSMFVIGRRKKKVNDSFDGLVGSVDDLMIWKASLLHFLSSFYSFIMELNENSSHESSITPETIFFFCRKVSQDLHWTSQVSCYKKSTTNYNKPPKL